MSDFRKLKMALEQQLPIYYLASTETGLLEEAEQMFLASYGDADASPTVLHGPKPDLDEAVNAAGTISFFGTRRSILISRIEPNAMVKKDVDELLQLFATVENAVLFVTALFKDKRALASATSKKILKAAEQNGYALQFAAPTQQEAIRYIEGQARQYNTEFSYGAAKLLLERVGTDFVLLKNEVAKLAAICGYTTIDSNLVEVWGAHSLEADVFTLLRLIVAGNLPRSLAHLEELFYLRYEPVAITAILAGAFVDMYRVRVGSQHGKTTKQVFADMNYKGNPWRLSRASDNAKPFSTAQLQRAINSLIELDTALKSGASFDKEALVQATVIEIIQLRKTRQ